MINHLKIHHSSNHSYNAWTICEELLELRKLRVQTKKQAKLKYKGIFSDNADDKSDRLAHQESMGVIQSPGIILKFK